MAKIEQRRLIVLFLIVAGAILISLSILTGSWGSVSAQSLLQDEYVGIGECNDCHRSISRDFETTAHALTMLEASEFPEAIIADFTLGDEVRLYQFPDEDAPRPFTQDDITYVVGTGRIAQRYLIEVGDNDFRVLPAEWDVNTGTWQTISLSNGDSWQDNCASCHTTGFDMTSADWVDTAVTCEGCHGAGLEHVELADDAGGRISDEEMEGIVASIVTNPEPATCGTCHTRWTDAETCDDSIHCSIPAYDAWLSSPHANEVTPEGGEVDADHHMDFALACSDCHVFHNEDDPSATLVSDIPQENMCLGCHESIAGQLLQGETIVDNVMGSASAHHEEGLTCESCHNIHSVSSIPADITIATTCTDCHTDLSQASIRDFAHGAQAKVMDRLTMIDAVIAESENVPAWVNTVVETIHHDSSGGIHNFAYVSRLLDAVEVELRLVNPSVLDRVPEVTASDPAECVECHADIHGMWQNSPHANASLGESFQTAYVENGRPSYCMSCHASGYDPNTQTYIFEGVVCSTCHMIETGEHPPGPMLIANSSEMCGRCHSGEHSPEFNEWLISDHSAFNIDCVDCHVAHDNSLRLETVNETCSDCHIEAMNDEVHMGEDMTCVDCHMTRTGEEGLIVHHTMFFDPKTCAECHGDIHTLQLDPTRGLTEEETTILVRMEEEIVTLETKADTNLQSGIVGGAVGTLVLIGFLFIALRFGRIQ